MQKKRGSGKWIYLLPRTKLGKWCVLFFMLSILFFTIFFFMIGPLGMRGGATFFSNIPLAVNGIFMFGSGIISFFFGIAGIIARRERALVVFVSTGFGALVLFFVSGEILFPH